VTKQFSELTEDEKMMRLYAHFTNQIPEDSSGNIPYFKERYDLLGFAREKLAFLRAFHKIEE
jgi:hypothetical protein